MLYINFVCQCSISNCQNVKVKLASEVLSKPLSIAMNNTITSFTFPDREKIATVVPIDKKTECKCYLIQVR